MKRTMILFLLAAALLTVPVFADFGPKPQLTVRVENAPEELYYLDILAEGDASRYSEGTVGGLEEDELAALDPELLENLISSIPQGWYGCLTQGRLVGGSIDSDDDVFQFGYLGVPDVCRILIVTKSGETFLSEPFDRQVLQSSAAVDWAAKTVKTPPVFLGYVGILNIHADMVDIHIFIMSGIDNPDLIAVLIVNNRIGQHTEIGTLHRRQLIVSNFTAVIQFWLNLDKYSHGNAYACQYGNRDNGQKSLQQPAYNPQCGKQQGTQSLPYTE